MPEAFVDQMLPSGEQGEAQRCSRVSQMATILSPQQLLKAEFQFSQPDNKLLLLHRLLLRLPLQPKSLLLLLTKEIIST